MQHGGGIDDKPGNMSTTGRVLLITTEHIHLSQLISNQPYQHALHFLHAHIDMLNHSSIEHSRRNIPPTTFLLQVVETLQNDTFPVGETVSDVWKIVAR